MDFDNQKVYGDTSITDGLVFFLHCFNSINNSEFNFAGFDIMVFFGDARIWIAPVPSTHPLVNGKGTHDRTWADFGKKVKIFWGAECQNFG